jgi:hypothetical protein
MRQVSAVWFVQGEDIGDATYPTLFATKLDAEVYARELFPEESEDRRYARIYYREVYMMSGE